MVGFLTFGNKKFRHLDTQMRKLLEPTMKELIPFVDADAAAFNDYMVGFPSIYFVEWKNTYKHD